MTKIRQKYKGSASKIRINSNYPNKNVKLSVNRRTKIRIKKA